MTDTWRLGALLVLSALSEVAVAANDQHVCVAGADGRWNCGNAEQPPQAAALPQRSQSAAAAPVPPVLLMDPARFRPNQGQAAVSAPAAAASAPSAAAIPAAASPPSPPAAVLAARSPLPSVVSSPVRSAAAAPTRTAPGALRDFGSVSRSGYTVQLAAARSPNGFEQRLRELGIASNEAFAVPVQRAGGSVWLLCVGEFADVDTARAAAPRAASGAFPKPLMQLHAEYSAAH